MELIIDFHRFCFVSLDECRAVYLRRQIPRANTASSCFATKTTTLLTCRKLTTNGRSMTATVRTWLQVKPTFSLVDYSRNFTPFFLFGFGAINH